MLHYTYLHRRASDNQPFYIWKGAGDRANRKNHRNQHWHNTVNKHGLVVEIVCHWPTEREALDHEIFLIDCFKSMGYKLVNLTAGGEGQSGWVPSQETRAKISAAHMGRPSGRKGIPLSEDVKAKLSAARKGKKLSPETKAKLSVARKGKPKSPQHAKNIGLGRLGWVPSEETRRKIGDGNRGRKRTDQERMAQSMRLKGRAQSPEQIEAARLGRIAAVGKTDKPVMCIETGMSFKKIAEAVRWLRTDGFTKADASAISRVCGDPNRFAYGYHWKFI